MNAIVVKNRKFVLKHLLSLTLTIVCSVVSAQTVSEIITDYNGYYKTGINNINPVKPDNDHNLLAFSFNGTRYSTGVNDALLAAHGDNFTPANFRALPMVNITGNATSNTKIGMGAMADGVFNGAGPAPSRNLATYLVDGVNGLGLGTCVANLPAGTMFMSVSNVKAEQIGDGIPDILVTQIADPASSFDRYAFTDINGNMVGNYVDINLTNIQRVGQWVADFYEATGAAVLTSSFTQTPRDIRLWAADFSAFGINASNIQDIAYFKIVLSGNSDVAFVAYNTTTVTVEQLLSLPTSFREPVARVNRGDNLQSARLYPNPAISEVTLNHPLSRGGESLTIYALNGVAVARTAVKSGSSRTSIRLDRLKPGCYHVVYTDGTSRFAEKLIVK